MEWRKLEDEDQYQPEQEETGIASLVKAGLRHGARSIARGAETLLGMPGDLASLPFNAVSYLSGGRTPTYEQAQQMMPFPSMTTLPTSQQVRENVTKRITGQALEPQTEKEAGADEIIQDFVGLLSPSGEGSLAWKLGKPALQAISGNVADWATREMTGSELLGKGAKLGSFILAGTLGTRNKLEELKNSAYAERDAKLPEHARVNISPEIDGFQSEFNEIAKGDLPDKKDLLERFQALLNNISGTGTDTSASVKDLINLKKGWNQWLRNPKLSRDMRALIKRGVGKVNSAIARYGKENPEFYKNHLIGEEITIGLRGQDIIQRTIASHPKLQKLLANPLVQGLFGGSAGATIWKGGLANLPYAAGVAGTFYGAKEGARAIQLLSQSPIARRYYKNAIQAGLNNDVRAMAHNLSQLNKSADQYSDKNPEEIEINEGNWTKLED